MPSAVTTRPSPGVEELPRAPATTPAPGGAQLNSAVDQIADSWRRCMAEYRVDPKSQSAPNVITQSELKVSKEPLADVLLHAREEIDRLVCDRPAAGIRGSFVQPGRGGDSPSRR